jgi:hypothetical protein
VGVFGPNGTLPTGTGNIPLNMAGVEGHSIVQNGIAGESVKGSGVLGRSQTNSGVVGVTFVPAPVDPTSGVFGSSIAGGDGVIGFVRRQSGRAGNYRCAYRKELRCPEPRHAFGIFFCRVQPVTDTGSLCAFSLHTSLAPALSVVSVSSSPVPHIADNRLSALVHRDVLHRNLLLTSGSVSLEGLDLRRECPGELVERTLRAILLRKGFHLRELTRKHHGRHVDGSHLSREHGLHLIRRLYTFDQGEHEVRADSGHVRA